MEPNFLRPGELRQLTTTQIAGAELQPCGLAYDITLGKVVYKNAAGVVKQVLDVTLGEGYIDATELATALSAYSTTSTCNSTYDPKRTYKIYRALITQTSTNAPTVVVLQNELSAAVVWTRDSTGTYFGTLTGAFTENKTFGVCHVASPTTGDARVSRVNADKVVVQAVDVGAVSDIGNNLDNVLPALADGILNNASLEILVYN